MRGRGAASRHGTARDWEGIAITALVPTLDAHKLYEQLLQGRSQGDECGMPGLIWSRLAIVADGCYCALNLRGAWFYHVT